jgi:hypothetical protein
MKTSILFFFFLFSVFAKADTITTWKVSYNNKILKQFYLGSNLSINLKSKDYKPDDYLTIKFTDDRPCGECSYELNVIKEGKQTVYILNTNDKYKLMKIPLKEIIKEFKSERQYDFFVVYFTEISKKGKRDSGMRLLNIKIE